MNDLMKNVRIVEVYSDVAGHKKGASLGIDALRASSKEMNADYYEKLQLDSIKNEYIHEEESPFKHAKYADVIEPVISKLAHKIKEIREENQFPIVIAGDHSSCAGTMHGLKMAHPDAEIGVVYIDAHADFHSPYTSGSGNMHGMPLAMACAIDNLECKRNELSDAEKEYWERLKLMARWTP